jgi:hypothetical protein
VFNQTRGQVRLPSDKAAVGASGYTVCKSLKTLAPDEARTIASAKPTKTMNYNIATILAVIAILFVLLTYISGAPLVPVAVILLALAIIFGGSTFRRV